MCWTMRRRRCGPSFCRARRSRRGWLGAADVLPDAQLLAAVEGGAGELRRASGAGLSIEFPYNPARSRRSVGRWTRSIVMQNKYSLVKGAARRARQLQSGAPALGVSTSTEGLSCGGRRSARRQGDVQRVGEEAGDRRVGLTNDECFAAAASRVCRLPARHGRLRSVSPGPAATCCCPRASLRDLYIRRASR